MQFAICNDEVYIIEANPRASRTVPIVSKVTGISLARYATEIMLGKKLKELGLKSRACRFIGVKEAVFPFNMFPEVDPVLGPEMRLLQGPGSCGLHSAYRRQGARHGFRPG